MGTRPGPSDHPIPDRLPIQSRLLWHAREALGAAGSPAAPRGPTETLSGATTRKGVPAAKTLRARLPIGFGLKVTLVVHVWARAVLDEGIEQVKVMGRVHVAAPHKQPPGSGSKLSWASGVPHKADEVCAPALVVVGCHERT